ncbi:MAG: GNAT family N-acetyltransferase [Erysipelotrichaceae bacterium]|nr:GNAT family N-acetyltransferase [Erysipelotrichaceae bacterium]
MPFTTKEHYKEAIDYMIQYSHEHDFEFMIDCAIENFVKDIKSIYQDKLLYQHTPHNDDYIYDRGMHQSLAGKKMQKRRNHYNAFIRTYSDYIYRDLDPMNDFDTVLSCLEKWESEKDYMSESMTSEVRGIMNLLSYHKILDFKIGGIFINKHLEAFIIASKLNHSTIQIHVEKANKDIRGLYPAILKEFLEHHFSGYEYINREEDMGLENLKKSKLSLHPIKMIHKFRIYERNIHITQAKKEDREDIKKLWQTCFEDEDEISTNYYFDNLYDNHQTYVIKHHEEILSAMQIVPMDIMHNNKIQNSYFILGVCTNPHLQGQGLMKELMNYVLSKYQQYPIYLQAYVPDIYKSFGFHISHHLQVIEFIPHFEYETLNISHDYTLLKTYYDIYTKQFNDYRIRDLKYFDLFIQRCQAFGENIMIFQDLGYFVYHIHKDNVIISEIIYLNEDAFKHMLSYFNGKNVLIYTDLKINIGEKNKNIVEMMSNQQDSDYMDNERFMNEIY